MIGLNLSDFRYVLTYGFYLTFFFKERKPLCTEESEPTSTSRENIPPAPLKSFLLLDETEILQVTLDGECKIVISNLSKP